MFFMSFRILYKPPWAAEIASPPTTNNENSRLAEWLCRYFQDKPPWASEIASPPTTNNENSRLAEWLCRYFQDKHFLNCILCISLCIIILPSTIYAKKPAWLNPKNLEKQYGSEAYMKALAANSGGDSEYERINSARNNALAALASQIRVKIDVQLIDKVSENSGVTKEYTELIIKSESNLILPGVETKTYYDAGKRKAYALAVLNRVRTRHLAVQDVEKARKNIEYHLARGDSAYKNEDLQAALEAYTLCSAEFMKLSRSLGLLQLLGGNIMSGIGMPGQTSSADFRYEDVKNRIGECLKKEIETLEEAALILSHQVLQNLREGASLICEPFSYEKTGFSSRFAERFRLMLMEKLNISFIREAGSENGKFTPKSHNYIAERAAELGADWLLEGRIFPGKSSLDIIIILTNLETTVKSNLVSLEIPFAIIEKEGYDYLPKNYDRLVETAEIFNEFENAGQQILELWTDRGKSSVVFHEGDTIQFKLRVSRPGYLSILDLMDNGLRTPLAYNYYIDQSKVNQVITLPIQFQCFPPFGCESIIASYSANPFPNFKTEIVYLENEEYEVLSEDLEKYLNATRGFKRISSEIPAFSEETILNITTMK